MKRKQAKRREILVQFVVILVMCQLIAFAFQSSRYHFRNDVDSDYACVQMSRDCEKFFESLGIRVYQMKGFQEMGEITESNGSKTKTYLGHQWILLDLGGINIPYDCTALMPWNPMWEGFASKVQVSDGYVIDGEYFEDINWQKI